MTLDNLLKEVEPILQGSHFTHPSFQEVLAARQFADEINSGQLTITRAAYAFWLYDPAEDLAKIDMEYFDDLYPNHIKLEPRGLKSEWKPVLAHMAGMLSKDNADEFIDVIGVFHSEEIKGLSDGKCARYEILEDLAICSKFIGLHQNGVSPGKNAKFVLDTLKSEFLKNALIEMGEKDLSYMARFRLTLETLTQTRSAYMHNAIKEKVERYLGKKGAQFFDSEVYKPK